MKENQVTILPFFSCQTAIFCNTHLSANAVALSFTFSSPFSLSTTFPTWGPGLLAAASCGGSVTSAVPFFHSWGCLQLPRLRSSISPVPHPGRLRCHPHQLPYLRAAPHRVPALPLARGGML